MAGFFAAWIAGAVPKPQDPNGVSARLLAGLLHPFRTKRAVVDTEVRVRSAYAETLRRRLWYFRLRGLGPVIACAGMLLGPASPANGFEALSYRGTVEFDPESASVSAALMIDVPLAGTERSLVFFLNPGLEISKLDGEGVLGHRRIQAAQNPIWNSLEIEFDPQVAGRRLTFEIIYDGSPVFPGDGINRIGPDWIELSADSAWHPILSSLSHPIRADLSLRFPDRRRVVTSGVVRETPQGVRLVSGVPQIDIAFIAARELDRVAAPSLEVFHRGSRPKDIARLIDRAGACRNWLDHRFGPDSRLPPLRFVVTGREESGYARQNYIVLTRIEERELVDLTIFVCHELAHFWSRGAPAGTVENWLNEGFAELISAQAVRDLYGNTAYRAMVAEWMRRAAVAESIWTQVDARRRSHAVQYGKAPLLLHRLESRIGRDAFAELLTRYALDPIDSTQDLLGAIGEISGSEQQRWFLEQLAKPGPFSDPDAGVQNGVGRAADDRQHPSPPCRPDRVSSWPAARGFRAGEEIPKTKRRTCAGLRRALALQSDSEHTRGPGA